MHVYRVETREQGRHFATKRDAVREARRALRDDDVPSADVSRITLVPMTKDAIVRLLNYEGQYVDREEHLATFTRKGEK